MRSALPSAIQVARALDAGNKLRFELNRFVEYRYEQLRRIDREWKKAKIVARLHSNPAMVGHVMRALGERLMIERWNNGTRNR